MDIQETKKIIILGMHRSGTSVVTSMVERMGAWCSGPDKAMHAQVDNPGGFWERRDVVDLNDHILDDLNLKWHSVFEDINQKDIENLVEKYSKAITKIIAQLDHHPVWVVKDPRLCLTWPIWQPSISDAKVVVVLRHPIAVARSLNNRNHMPNQIGLALWAWYMKSLSSAISEREVYTLNHQELMTDPKAEADRVYDWLKRGVPELLRLQQSDLHDLYRPELVNHVVNKEDQLLPEVETIWSLARSGEYNKIIGVDLSGLMSSIDHDLLKVSSELTETMAQVYSQSASLKTIAESLLGYKFSREYRLSLLLKRLKRMFEKNQPKGAIDKIGEELPAAGCKIELLKNDSSISRIFTIARRSPLKTIRGLTPGKLRTLWRMVIDSQARININEALARYEEIITDQKVDLIKPGSVTASEICLYTTKQPLVSIIVPVYNQYKTTLACLKSISNAGDQVNYEVIIADDCSTDQSRDIQNLVSGIRVIRTNKNVGFLKNCNNAAAYAQGKYILFLNNDTNVQPGWLTSLAHTIESDNKIGIIGPKFIYSDGILQEAGGIIFQDGSGWNYGRRDNPALPQYCFLRNVDYISGAALMVRKVVWDQVGGFDICFSPAYYEDTDICFKAREKGYRVVYEPKSRVVHYEGMSHGTDLDTGIKQFQVRNKKKFREKWVTVLEKKHSKGPGQIFNARHHGKPKATILVIDNYVPMHDKDAGSRSTRKYLELFIEQGLRVIFLPDNFYPHQPYTEQLQSNGVEVLYGEYYKENWRKWLKQNHHSLDAIYIHRPHVAERYIDFINTLKGRPRTVYFGHDLHFLRCQRELSVSGDRASRKKAEYWKKKELNIMKKMDISLYPGLYEVEEIKTIDPSLCVSHIPLTWYSDSELYQQPRLSYIEVNILFVGGFGHPPNLDGLDWFLKKVWPTVLTKYTDVKLTIIGSKCPEEIKTLDGPSIRVLGEVDDNVLDSEYKRATAVIVPLRYGAGIKGKILEAMAKGVPVCTTPIGAEGLPGDSNNYLQVADGPQEFAIKLADLTKDQELSKRLSDSAKDIITKYFSRDRATVLIDILLDRVNVEV